MREKANGRPRSFIPETKEEDSSEQQGLLLFFVDFFCVFLEIPGEAKVGNASRLLS